MRARALPAESSMPRKPAKTGAPWPRAVTTNIPSGVSPNRRPATAQTYKTVLLPTVITVDPVDAIPKVLRGTADVIFHSSPLKHRELVTIHLGDEPCGIYCGPGHPLFPRRRLDLETVLEHAFVAPPPDAHGDTLEGWPAEIPRRIALHVDQMRVGLEVCARGNLLAVLPDVIARSLGRDTLRRLPLDLIPPAHLFATHRPRLEFESRADAVVAAVQQHLAGNRAGR